MRINHLLVLAAFGALAAGQARFEVISVKPAAPEDQSGHTSSRMSVDNARLKYTNVTVADVIQQAYAIQRNQVTGPDWLDSDRFDIAGTIAPGERGHVPEMLQALLADRFHLAIHRETKDLPIYR